MEEHTIIDEIVSTARMRLERYDRLVALAEEQQSILVENRHSELAQNLAVIDPLLFELKQINKRQENLFRHLEESQDGGQATRLPDINKEYEELAQRTAEKADRLRTLTEVNRQLLSNAMDFVNFSMGIICKVVAEQQLNADAKSNPAIVLDLKV